MGRFKNQPDRHHVLRELLPERVRRGQQQTDLFPWILHPLLGMADHHRGDQDPPWLYRERRYAISQAGRENRNHGPGQER